MVCQASLPALMVCCEPLLMDTLCGWASGLIGMVTVNTP